MISFQKYISLLEEKDNKRLQETINYLSTKEKLLFLSTSNRSDRGEGNYPKSELLAQHIAKEIGEDKVTFIKVPDLKIYNCCGNVSDKTGNHCGEKRFTLNDKKKNPTGDLRCSISHDSKDDELWKVTIPLFEADTVMFFASVRWGQANAYYQKLIERLDWIENRHSTLGEDNIVKDKDAGFVCVGQNWNGNVVVETQKKVLEFYGFKTPDPLFWNWQFTTNAYDESKESYKEAFSTFKKEFNL